MEATGRLFTVTVEVSAHREAIAVGNGNRVGSSGRSVKLTMTAALLAQHAGPGVPGRTRGCERGVLLRYI
jgi:hypothetical protein